MLKLEVGKTYITDCGGFKIRIICTDRKDDVWPVTGLYSYLQGNSSYEGVTSLKTDGSLNLGGAARLVKEYVEPVVHRRDVVWYSYPKALNPNIVYCCTLECNDSGASDWKIHKRETVSYTVGE